MNHTYIEEHGVVPLYIMGNLTAEERSRFEVHLVNCSRCLDDLDLTDEFRHALKQLEATEVLHDRKQSPALFNFLALSNRPRHTALLTYAMLLLLATSASLFGFRALRLKKEISELEGRNVGSHAETAPKTVIAGNLQSVAPLFRLEITRGSDIASSKPSMNISIPGAEASIVLALELDPDFKFERYRAHISDASEETVWSADKIPSPPSGAIAIPLSGRLFRDGNYFLTVEGLSYSGHYIRVARYAFSVSLKHS